MTTSDEPTFSKQQVAQLKELLDDRLEAQDIRIVTELDRRFAEQQRWVETKFTEQDKWLRAQFADERSYYHQLIKEALSDLREQLDRLSERTHEDHTAALEDLEDFNKRLVVVESAVAKFQAH